MLKLLWGRAGSGKTHAILKDICNQAALGHDRLIWLVPEQFSHECERLLAREGGAPISLRAEVLSFHRMSDRVFALEGGLSQPLLDEAGRLLTMRLAVDSVRERLNLWRHSAYKTSFLPSLLGTIDECKCYGITPEHLMLAKNESSGGSAEKLAELALIYAAYEALLDNGTLDPRDRMTLLAQKLENGDFASGTRLYVDGFVTFTPQEARVLDMFISKALSVTVALCGTPDDSFFDVTRRTAERLTRSAANFEEEILATDRRHKMASLSAVEAHLFDDTSISVPDDGSVRITCACSLPDECAVAAQAISSLARQGFRYRDMAVVVPSLESYQSQLSLAFSLHGVPAFFDATNPADSNPLVTSLRSAASIVTGNWALEDVLALIHTGLFYTGHRRTDRLEDYLRRWNIHGANWTTCKPWTFHPRGFVSEINARDRRLLFSVNVFRSRLWNGLNPLRGEASANQWVSRYIKLIETFSVDIMLQKRVDSLYGAGQAEKAEKYRQIWDVLRNAFGQISSILGERLCSAAEFSELLMLAISGYRVGTIPVYLDSAAVGEAGRMRRTSAKVVFCLGCSEVNFPKVTTPVSLLSAEERSALESIKAELPPDDDKRLERELFNIYTSFSLPSEKLRLSFVRESDGSAAPANALLRVAELTGTQIDYLPLVRWPKKKEPDVSGSLSSENVLALYTPRIALSASRIDQIFSCPFKFFCGYGLHAGEAPAQGFDPADIGSFTHEVLEYAGRSLAADPTVQIIPAAQEAVAAYIEKYLRGFDGFSEQFRAVFSHMARSVVTVAESLLRDLHRGDFIPLGHELSFYTDKPARENGFSVSLRGKVDRADLWTGSGGHYLRVIDYKTGNITFPGEEIARGLKMQMPLYLFTLADPENRRMISPYAQDRLAVLPAGILYVPARDQVVSSERRVTEGEAASGNVIKYAGLLSDNEQVLAAMGIKKEKPSERYPVKWNKDGSFSKSSHVADTGQWEALRRHVEEKTLEAASIVIGGNVSEQPADVGEPCKYCAFKSCCHYNC